MKLIDSNRRFNHISHWWAKLTNPDFRQIFANPIFVVGCGHSGTTLLLRVIGSHPQIHAILDESSAFAKKQLYRLREFDLEALHNNKKRWVEKTPIHIRRIDRIFKSRPNAKVIIIIRDGRDVADSIRARKGSLEEGVRRWVKDNSAGEKWWSDSRVMKIYYEDLIKDFQGQAQNVLRFLGEDYNDDVVNYHQKLHHPMGAVCPETVANQDHLKYRMWQVSQPLFDGRGRWLNNFSEADKKIFKEMAGQMLIRYGYEKDDDW